MNSIKSTLRSPLPALLLIFLIALILDVRFGEAHVLPNNWLPKVFFAQLVAIACVSCVHLLRKSSKKAKLLWALAFVSVIGIILYALFRAGETPKPDPYNSTLGGIYYAVENVIPYYSPFHNIDKDYLLFPATSEFLKMELLLLAPALIGVIIVKSSSNKETKQRVRE